MMQARWIHQTAAAGALALAVLTAGALVPAQAQDDAVQDNSIWNLDQRIWGGIVRGLGLRDPNTPVIEYRERSPLVVPPSSNLPAPQAKAPPRDPAWPNDPDVAKARKAADAKRKRNTGVDTSRVIYHQGDPITPDQLNRPGAPAPGTSGRSNAPAPGTDIDGKPVLPSELGYFGGLFSGRAWGFSGYQDETGTFTGEPNRNALTEPPPGYQIPSPTQPYGVTRRVERSAPQQFDPARQ